MKVKVPAKTVDVCSLCQRPTSVLDKCVRCGKDYCLVCRAIVMGCIHRVDICENCGRNEKVRTVIERFVPDFLKLIARRNAAIKRVDFEI